MSNLFPTQQEKDALRQALNNFIEERNDLASKYPGLEIYYDLLEVQTLGDPSSRLVIQEITYTRMEN